MSSAFLQVNKMKITKQELVKVIKEELKQIIKEEYQRALSEQGDLHPYEGGTLTDNEVSEFAEAYSAVEQLRRINPKALPEEVEDAILDMLNKLAVYL